MTEQHGSVVIVGGGIGGVATAAALRDGGWTGSIALIDDSASFPYDRPPLSKEYLVGNKDLTGIALQQPGWYDENGIELIAPARVNGLVLRDDEVIVELEGRDSMEADYVVLATGGHAIRPPIPGVQSKRVFVLREHEDSDGLREYLQPGKKVLVVGGGLIGAEAASTARKLGADVVLVDPVTPLAPAVGKDVAEWLHSLHAQHGVETVTGTVTEFVDDGDAITAQLSDGTERTVDAVLIGVGMSSEVTLAQDAGLEIERGILTDERQVTSHPRVLAIGDAAQLRGSRRTEQWEAAQHDGKRAAATIIGTEQPALQALWFWSDRYDLHLEGVGVAPGTEGTTQVVRGTIGEPPFSVFALSAQPDGRAKVVGAVAVDDSNVVRAGRRLIDRGIEVDPAALADTTTDLRKLVRG